VDLASGASATYTVTVIAPPSGSMTNVASGSNSTPDSDPTNNNGTKTNSQVITSVQPLADVAVTKTGSVSVPPGGLATYTLTVTNGGPSTASNVMVFDQLPASYAFASAVPAPASTNGGLVRWPLFNLTAFASSNFSLTVTSMVGGVFTNIAYATNSTPDPDPTNNNGTKTNSQAITSVQPLADVAVTKTGLASVFAGGLATYTLTVTNSGPSTATNVVTADTLPAGATFSSASGSTTLSNGVVRWAAVDLASGASATYTVTVIAPPSGSMTNVASGSSATPDPDPTNNNGTKTNSQVITFVQPLADVAVSKTGSASVPPGGLATYTLTVTNGGPSTATNVVVFDQLPASYTFVSAVPAPASTSGGLVRWPLFNLAAFATSNFSLTVTSMISGVFTNIAYATNSTADPDPTN